jgi:hypothetical protein
MHGHHDHDDDCDGHGHWHGYWHRPYWWYPGSYYYYSYAPAPVFISPFFCGLCSLGFAGDTFFHQHVHYVHAVPFDSIGSYLYTDNGRVVFNGW